MLKDNLVLSKYKNDDSFVKSCIFNRFREDEYKTACELLEKATTTNEFIEMYFNNDIVKYSHGWCELVKLDEYMYDCELSNLFDKLTRYTTDSDVGSVRIGNEYFTFNVSNNYGDGCTCVAVANDDRHEMLINNLMIFQTDCKGKFNIYHYDVDGDEIVTTLTGNYAIYSAIGYVAFVKWGD